jgi:AraC family transcriptional regulator, regulatory protein of adaptative response / methylated-DNA-[protein]-cysteine methyltransferase
MNQFDIEPAYYLSDHYSVVERTIEYISSNCVAQPSLDDVAREVQLSTFYLQKIFKEWVGVSPKRFLQYLTKRHALEKISASSDLLSVSNSLGISHPSRLHDLMVTCEAMSPSEIKLAGKGLDIRFGLGESPFGQALIAWTSRGVCHFAFVNAALQKMINELYANWPRALFVQNDVEAREWLTQIFQQNNLHKQQTRVHLLIKGSNFQMKVWEALINIEMGQVYSYQQLAQQANCPRAQRAVGSALAANYIGYLIPCHRVIRATGETGHYRWGDTRKKALLAWESAQIGIHT